jgi:hypothetical protein
MVYDTWCVMIEGMRFNVNGLITVSESLMGTGCYTHGCSRMNEWIWIYDWLIYYLFTSNFVIMFRIYCSVDALYVMCHVSTLHQSNSTPASMHCFHQTTWSFQLPIRRELKVQLLPTAIHVVIIIVKRSRQSERTTQQGSNRLVTFVSPLL